MKAFTVPLFTTIQLKVIWIWSQILVQSIQIAKLLDITKRTAKVLNLFKCKNFDPMYVKATEGFEERNILLCEFESGRSIIENQ